MNTASRIETTGERDRTHLSKATADLLTAAGNVHWITPRNGTVIAKGKGKLQTFWLTLNSKGDSLCPRTDEDATVSSQTSIKVDCEMESVNGSTLTTKDLRLIDWNVNILQGRLQAIVAQRNQTEADHVNLEPEVVSQLSQFVTGIAARYHRQPFHSFCHASHVVMSVTKILSRAVAPEQDQAQSRSYTAGILAEPLTQFALVFSAIIHDVAHPGVPNSRLIEEGTPLAVKYSNKSVAENFSIEVGKYFIAWERLSLS
jgi:3'5'-cyclic nucleotide phosphodiesterase/Adenylate and Guanylate cyclase catalytic domain